MLSPNKYSINSHGSSVPLSQRVGLSGKTEKPTPRDLTALSRSQTQAPKAMRNITKDPLTPATPPAPTTAKDKVVKEDDVFNPPEGAEFDKWLDLFSLPPETSGPVIQASLFSSTLPSTLSSVSPASTSAASASQSSIPKSTSTASSCSYSEVPYLANGMSGREMGTMIFDHVSKLTGAEPEMYRFMQEISDRLVNFYENFIENPKTKKEDDGSYVDLSTNRDIRLFFSVDYKNKMITFGLGSASGKSSALMFEVSQLKLDQLYLFDRPGGTAIGTKLENWA